MARTQIKKELLEWAIERSGKSRKALEKKYPKLSEWLKEGGLSPTLKQAESFATATHTPLGFFFLDTPPKIDLPIPYFRTLHDKSPKTPSTELIDTIYTMEQRKNWLKEYLESLGTAPLSFVGSCSKMTDPNKIASVMYSSLEIQEGWAANSRDWEEAFSFLIKAIEKAGILVMANGIIGNNTHRPLDPKEFRGFVLVDRIAPLVFINSSDWKAAQMFTLTHELAHVFIGSSAAFDLNELHPSDDPTEQLCNKVAAEFLVPKNRLKKEWNQKKNLSLQLQELSKLFRVSPIVVSRRALDLNLISKPKFFSFYNNYISKLKKEKSRRKSGGGNFYATQTLRVGNSFGNKVVTAVKSGVILYTDAYRLTDLRGKTFEEFAQRCDGIKKVRGA